MYPFCKYSDGTEVVFSGIIKNYKEGNFTEEEIELFKTVVERGAHNFYRWAREGGIKIA